jgi:hypothetical protein
MRKFRIGITFWLAALLVVFVTGCGEETVIVPSVVSTVPANGAANVSVNTPISATFSVPMSPSTLTSTTFTVTAPSGAVAGAVSYSGTTATFTPSAALAYATIYTATITTGATDLGGTPLLASYVWTFTTITPAPVVVSTIPANGATNVAIGQVISATFSEAMNPATISGSTFTVTAPGGAVAGTVTYSGVTATFTPSSALAYSTVYTGTITTGAQDLAGTPPAANYVWTFTTITPPPTVISAVPANAATNVPISQALTATFSEAMTPGSVSGSTFTVTGPGGSAVAGTVTYSGVTATFTPAAALAHSTVYTATITTGATDVASQPLAANYVWTFTTITPVPTVVSTVPANGATNVPTSQALSATFSEAMNPATISGSTFTVTGPGGTAVVGAVTYSGVTATFTPAAALANSAVYTATITTGAADAAAQPLAANYVWTFTTITPVPTVISTVPANAATNVPITQALTATFSEAMNPASISGSTFTVTGPGGTSVSGTVTYSGVTATFTPAAVLAYSTVYTGTITTGASDPASQPLAANYVWTFTTITPVPTVVSTAPANGATNVPVSQVLTATFSEAMAPASISGSTFTVTGPGGAVVTGAVTYSGVTATFTPTAALAHSTVYTATITTGATDVASQPLAANYVWTFTTITPVPTVVSTVPANAATNVPVGQVLTATFSEPMASDTLDAASFTVTAGGITIPGAISYSGLVATFTPTSNLDYSTVYTATITTGAQDLAGQPLAANYVWTFTTISPTPAVISTIPVNGATGVPLSQVLSATFNEAMKCTTLTSTTFTLAGPGTTAVTGTVGCSGSVATFTPDVALLVNTLYTATITTGAQDLAGTAMASNYVWSFLTLPAPTPPTVISTVPVNGATAVPINQALTATFSVAMNAATIDTTTFTLTGPGATAVTGVVTYVPAGSVATFTPAANLTPSTLYTATITTGAEDLADVGLASNYVWTFTTAAAVIVVPPTVISTIPINGATGVPISQVITATFSTAMTPATITNPGTFTLTAGPGNTVVPGLIAYASVGNTLTFIPTANLTPGTVYTATITTGAQDLAGTPLDGGIACGSSTAGNCVWTFTAAAVVVVPPEIVSTVPANGATGVALNQAVSATFTEAMNPLTITTGTFQLTGPGGTAIAGTVSYDAINFIATFTPSAPLTASSSYIATVTDGATDLAGNPLGTTGAPNPWSFMTGAAVVPPPPILGPTVTLFGGYGGTAGMTNQGIETVINGYMGTMAVSTLITGFHDTSVVVAGVNECTYTETPLNIGLVNGLIETAPPPPTVGCPNEGTAATYAIAAEAGNEALTAYNTLAAIPNGLDVSVCPGCGGGNAGELGNRTLAPGVYKSAPGSFGITQGPLTLDAKGDPTATWVFQMASTLTVGTPTGPESVVLVNGAQAGNVYWQVGTAATINGIVGGGTMQGTIISQAGVSISTAGVNAITTLNGRALVLIGPVTMVNTVINVP